MDYSSDFDVDLRKGEEGEFLVKELAQGKKTIEVKRDYMVSRTGNIAIEIEYKGHPSGLSITKAEWWAFVLDGAKYNGESIIFIKTERLKKIVKERKNIKGTMNGGDNNNSVLVLVSLIDLIQ